MSLPKISFTKGQGGLGRTLPNEDNVSGIIFYDNTKPAGFSSGSSYVQKVLSVSDAENLGIVNDYADETQGTATLVITNAGATNDTLSLFISDIVNQTTISIGTYTSVGSLTTATEAIAISSFINSKTYDNGYTASASGSTVTITAPKGLGIAANTLFKNVTGVLAVTTSNFAGGVASKLAQYHYQVSEFFRLQPNGVLYVKINDVPTTYFATEITEIQTQAEGKLRQLAIFANAKTSITKADEDAIQNAVNSAEAIFGVSLSVLYSCDITSTTNLTSLPDQSQFTDNKVSTIISQSFSGQGYKLWKQTGKSVPTLGACLGSLSSSKVSDDIAWVGAYNVSDGTECEVIGFSNGQLANAVSAQLQEQLNGYRYIYLRKFIGVSGSFWNDSNTSVSTSSDYAYIENNRTLDKAIRLVRTNLIPELNSPLTLNADGTLTDVTIAHFTGLAKDALEVMNRNGELSSYSVVIPSTQNVLKTSTLSIVINIVPKGVARQISVTIGFTTSI